MINITNLIDDQKCYETVHLLRWKEGVNCPNCNSPDVKKNGKHNNSEFRQRYSCHTCEFRFDDLTRTIFEGSHISLKKWILCSYFMGLNLSNSQISQELEINIGWCHKSVG